MAHGHTHPQCKAIILILCRACRGLRASQPNGVEHPRWHVGVFRVRLRLDVLGDSTSAVRPSVVAELYDATVLLDALQRPRPVVVEALDRLPFGVERRGHQDVVGFCVTPVSVAQIACGIDAVNGSCSARAGGTAQTTACGEDFFNLPYATRSAFRLNEPGI